MSAPREIFILLSVCLVWGFHFVVMKVGTGAVPPIFYAAIRMTLVALLMAPFLRWRQGVMVRVLFGGLCLGGLNYAFMFTGVKYATASSAAITMELYVPFATILSVLFLGDRIGWPRIIGIATAFAGLAIIALGKSDPGDGGAHIRLGVGLMAASALSEAIGGVMVKQAHGVKPRELLAWFALVGSGVLWPLSFLFESGQGAALAQSDALLVIGAILYSAIGASIFGHQTYYWLLQRLPLSVVAPSMLLTTFIAICFGVALLGDPLSWRFVIGGSMVMAGVGLVILRSVEKQDTKAVLNDPAG